MKHDDFDRFGLALGACAELYGKTVSEAAMSLWWQALKRFPIEDVEKAFRQSVESADSGQFMPKPADLIRRLEGTSGDRSLIAWGKVLDAMQRVGAYQSVVFDDGAIHAAIMDMGGWAAICRSNQDELAFTQKRFCDLYRAYAQRPESSYPAKLIGDHESTNRMLGHKTADPVLVGDAEKAKGVMSLGTDGGKTALTSLGAALEVKKIGVKRD